MTSAVYEVLLRSLTPSGLGVLGRRGADFAAAEDAVQEALVEASAPGRPTRQHVLRGPAVGEDAARARHATGHAPTAISSWP